ncbi:hypothetical protein HK097_000506 [Rhizophlyctis rosea]|uniref:Uncharacterized protein n=1 Tax=Rhizophlyctis rosea TaxID=64517 RepID=A0AAD5SDJ9_9FUNG|nr:hypothetical protein HK097_000506 [Rhizophlyctis rosea]
MSHNDAQHTLFLASARSSLFVSISFHHSRSKTVLIEHTTTWRTWKLGRIGDDLREIQTHLNAQIPTSTTAETLNNLSTTVRHLIDIPSQLYRRVGPSFSATLDITALESLVASVRPVLQAGLSFASSLVLVDELTAEVNNLKQLVLQQTVQYYTQMATIESMKQSLDQALTQKGNSEEKYEELFGIMKAKLARRVFNEVIDVMELIFWRRTGAAGGKRSLRSAVDDNLILCDTVRSDLRLANPSLEPFLKFIDNIKNMRRLQANVSKADLKLPRRELIELAEAHLMEGNAVYMSKVLDWMARECNITLDDSTKPLQSAYF